MIQSFNMRDFKKWLPDILMIVLFAAIAFVYFYPADVEDRILYQHDTSAGAGAGQEAAEYQKTHDGERTRWTNGLFSGMPTYQIAPSYDSMSSVSFVEKAYHLWLPDCVWFLFVYLLGFYILLRAFNFKQYLAALGSILWAFSTYFLIIITAGHWWKVMALAYLPPMIAGVVLAYRGKYLWGLVVTALFAAFEAHANHFQMTYYYLFVIAAMVIAFIIEGLRKKEYAHLLKATGISLAGGLLGVLINSSTIYHTKQYEKESDRGGTELVSADGKSSTGGMNRDQILAYSYGIGETWSLLIPNVQGGASMRGDADSPTGTGLYPLAENSAVEGLDMGEVLKNKEGEELYVYIDKDRYPYYLPLFYDSNGQLKIEVPVDEKNTLRLIGDESGKPRAVTMGSIIENMPQYWGDGGTMGPVYVGALVVLLFVLSLFVVKGPIKWTLLAVTIMSVLLAWGSNFVGFSDFFINNVPMYAKFRTPESILVIAEFTIPLLAMLGLKRIIEEPELLTRKVNVMSLMGCISAVLIILGISWDSSFFILIGILALVAVMVLSVMRYYQIKMTDSVQKVLDCELPVTPLLSSFILVGGVLLLFALMPGSFFDFVSESEKGGALSVVNNSFFKTLEDIRQSIFTADCWRSLIIVVLGVAVLWLYAAKKLKALPTIAIIAVICLVDLWQINQRYLNADMFRPKSVIEEAHQMTKADEIILQDKTLDYRVLNLTENPFNENNTSYYHKSIGGYHAAKLGRYKELIDSCLYKEVGYAAYASQISEEEADQYFPVVNMLNTRYVIGSDGQPLLNPHAFGNAWFVNKVHYVDNANKELEALHQIDLRNEAVADKRFQSVLGSSPAEEDSTATVKMVSYEPNELKYSVNSEKGGVLVFSEIYYPHGWTATVDGKPVELGRVNYVLRAMKVAPGKHEIVLTFKPSSISTTETVSYISQVILLLLFIVACVLTFRSSKKKE